MILFKMVFKIFKYEFEFLPDSVLFRRKSQIYNFSLKFYEILNGVFLK